MVDKCIFCSIVSGTIPAYIVYQDEKTAAFLDTYPLAHGHLLVIPKTHAPNLAWLDDSDAQALFSTLNKMVKTIQKALNTDSTTIGINNGPASGQEVPHAHIHLVPRFPGDGGGSIHAVMSRRPRFSKEEMHEVAEKIREALSA